MPEERRSASRVRACAASHGRRWCCCLAPAAVRRAERGRRVAADRRHQGREPDAVTRAAEAARASPRARGRWDHAAALGGARGRSRDGAALLRAGANVNALNRYGVTPLALAATNGNAGDRSSALLKAGADANAALPEGETVLMTAARTGIPTCACCSSSTARDVNAQESWLGETALMWAARRTMQRGESAARARREARSRVEPRPATNAEVGGQTILPRGGFTALMYAAREGAIDAARALADGGADLNAGDRDGVTALILAIINAHYELAVALLDKGANPNVADSTGMTPLYAAVDMNTLQFMHGRPTPRPSGDLDSVDMIKALLDPRREAGSALKTPILQRHNNGPNQNLGEGTTPLMRAAKSGDVAVMRLLLAAGADPTLRQKNQNTLLMLAAGFGRKFNQNADSQEYERGTEDELLAAVKLCVELGLDVNAANVQGDSAMHVAARRVDRALPGAARRAARRQEQAGPDAARRRDPAQGRQRETVAPRHAGRVS